MKIGPDLVGMSLPPALREWDSDHAIIYALGIGAGGGSDLAYTTENTVGVRQRVNPTFASVLGFPAGWLADAGFPESAVLHAEHSLGVHRPLPVAGSVLLRTRVVAVHDTGAHALVTLATELLDTQDNSRIAINHTTLHIRGAGGFGGTRPEPRHWAVPERSPDVVTEYDTSPTQALLYRMSGDRNRLHSDPAAAREAGYPRPILHGLCTFGFAGRAMLHAACDGNPDLFGSLSARFTDAVEPGDRLTIPLWFEGRETVFRMLIGQRVVMDRGIFKRR